MLYGTLLSRCNPQSCPKMGAGPKFVYLWADGVKITRGIQVSASEYVEHLMNWFVSLLNNTELFPTKLNKEFLPRFIPTMCTVYKKFFRVYAHIYHTHLAHIIALGIEDHLNASFRQFMEIVFQFRLVSCTDLIPLMDLIFYMGFTKEEIALLPSGENSV
eukprot:TRINITY_DN2825_c0_g2_i3.p1 TRINITY_DN2825_c0_g2~~TRINITY_DN2825_c0_g2_i3.p1  ORF type:complete len:160 (+),score=18.45 TRINITY_DN2825_c0_g2_i3:356-835(+)